MQPQRIWHHRQQEIVTYQGINFTSSFIKQLHAKLGIQCIWTTSYHHQRDGFWSDLITFVNPCFATLFQIQGGTGWRCFHSCSLLVRKFPRHYQASLPFALRYGWPWTCCKKAGRHRGLVKVSYPTSYRWGSSYTRIMNVGKTLASQKFQYIWNVRHQVELKLGEKVLHVQSTSTSKLLVNRQGTFEGVKKVVPNEVEHPD